MKIYLALCILLGFTISASAEGPLASESDLKAGFCWPFVKSEFEAVQGLEGITTQPDVLSFQDAVRNRMTKLRRYLAARQNSMDEKARLELLAAIKSGEEEVSRRSSAADVCIAQLGGSTKAPLEKVQECVKKKTGLSPRIECEKLEFLPY